MSLCPSIPYEDGLETLRKRVNEPAASEIPTEKPPFACIFMDEVETEFFKSEELQPFLWL